MNFDDLCRTIDEQSELTTLFCKFYFYFKMKKKKKRKIIFYFSSKNLFS